MALHQSAAAGRPTSYAAKGPLGPAIPPSSSSSTQHRRLSIANTFVHDDQVAANSRINTISYRDAAIKAQIDTTMAVSDVIRQLCANAHLGVQEPPALFALRDDITDDLIDGSNLAKKIQSGANFKLTASPVIEAAETVDTLSSQDERTLKMATHTLQRLIREPPFTEEFLRRGGLKELVTLVLGSSGGNTLAYALTSCQNLFETAETGWEGLSGEFIAKIVHILVSQERINVCRPATAILKKLVLTIQKKSRDDPALPSYGFEVVYEKIQKEPAFLPTLVQRLSSADATLCLYSLSLLNSLMRHVTEPLLDHFTSQIEKLKTPEAVARLMDSSRGEELSSSILDFQNNMLRVYHLRYKTQVTASDKRHVAALSYIWRQARLPEDRPTNDPKAPPQIRSKWRRLGFPSENIASHFAGTGWLGLECCETFVRSNPDAFHDLVMEHLIKQPESKRCSWALASMSVVETLAEYWGIVHGFSTSTGFRPFLLSFPRVHTLALNFFFRMWDESGATTSDFDRISALVRSQVQYALSDEASKTWEELERHFLESEYRTVRERQIKELAQEDDYASKASIRNLRSRLYRESYEFMRRQRIQCLYDGAWFQLPSITTMRYAPTGMSKDASSFSHRHHQQHQSVAMATSVSAPVKSLTGRKSSFSGLGGLTSRPTRAAEAPPIQVVQEKWRFYRLSPNKRYLHYLESDNPDSSSIRRGLDDLTERLDLSQVTDLAVHCSPAPPAPAQTSAYSKATSTRRNGQSSEEPHRNFASQKGFTRPSKPTSMTRGGSKETSSKNQNENQNRRQDIGAKQDEEEEGYYSFSLLRSPDFPLAEFRTTCPHLFSEWLDGLSMLRCSDDSDDDDEGSSRNNGRGTGSRAMTVNTAETAEYIEALTDISLKIRLLDLTGNKIDLPDEVELPELPDNLDFFFAEI